MEACGSVADASGQQYAGGAGLGCAGGALIGGLIGCGVGAVAGAGSQKVGEFVAGAIYGPDTSDIDYVLDTLEVAAWIVWDAKYREHWGSQSIETMAIIVANDSDFIAFQITVVGDSLSSWQDVAKQRNPVGLLSAMLKLYLEEAL